VVIVLAGEWVNANLLFAAAFLVAVIGVTGLGWFVMRGNRINELSGPSASHADAGEPADSHHQAH